MPREIALFPLSLPHTGIGQRPGRGRRDRGIDRHALWVRQLLNAASRSPARVVFRHLAILPNPSPEAPERRYGGDFQGQGLRDPRRRSDDALATECRGRLRVPRDHWSRYGKNGSDGPCLRAVLHTDAVQTAPVPLGLQLGLDGPQLLFACSHATWTEGRDRSRSDARSWHHAIRASNSRMVRFRPGKPCRCRHRRP
jgi:hypothetical protein